jgi:GntR family transcriptional regulator
MAHPSKESAHVMASRILYKEVQKQLTQSLVEGEWLPGSMLPSEPKLAQRYNVGISTIRAAVRELELANVLVRAQGRGTFVAQFDDRPSAHKFLNITREDGIEARPQRTLLSFERIDAPDDITQLLRLGRASERGQVFKLGTLVTLAAEPVYYSNVFLPVAHFPRLRKAMLPDGNRSLYSLYQEHFNIHVVTVQDSLSAKAATTAVAKLCGIRPGTPVLHLRRVAFGYNGTRVEVRRNWINTAHHCYRLEQGIADT